MQTTKTAIHIDGSSGEGGGQILRSSLALSMCTGKPFRIEKIRAGRAKPGLMRQHLTSVKAAATVCAAEVQGATIGSTELSFTPGAVKAGEYRFAIGSAGSTTLVFQTVLPALLCADGPSTLTLEGGTHNTFAPPFDFLARVFLPIVNRMGPRVTVELLRHGFVPAGGGRFTVTIEPAKQLGHIELLERGATVERRARALVANLPRHIAERELKIVARKLGWEKPSLIVEEVPDSAGPGNIVMIELHSEHATELCTGFGQPGVYAEAVADEAVDAMRKYLAAEVPVGEHLADQVMLPMALAGSGIFRTLPLSRHSTTHIELIRKFLDLDVRVEREGGRRDVVRIG